MSPMWVLVIVLVIAVAVLAEHLSRISKELREIRNASKPKQSALEDALDALTPLLPPTDPYLDPKTEITRHLGGKLPSFSFKFTCRNGHANETGGVISPDIDPEIHTLRLYPKCDVCGSPNRIEMPWPPSGPPLETGEQRS